VLAKIERKEGPYKKSHHWDHAGLHGAVIAIKMVIIKYNTLLYSNVFNGFGML
jgi:hypothetical protein